MSFVRLLHTLFLGPRVTEPAGSTPAASGDVEVAGAELRTTLAALYGGRSSGFERSTPVRATPRSWNCWRWGTRTTTSSGSD